MALRYIASDWQASSGANLGGFDEYAKGASYGDAQNAFKRDLYEPIMKMGTLVEAVRGMEGLDDNTLQLIALYDKFAAFDNADQAFFAYEEEKDWWGVHADNAQSAEQDALAANTQENQNWFNQTVMDMAAKSGLPIATETAQIATETMTVTTSEAVQEGSGNALYDELLGQYSELAGISFEAFSQWANREYLLNEESPLEGMDINGFMQTVLETGFAETDFDTLFDSVNMEGTQSGLDAVAASADRAATALNGIRVPSWQGFVTIQRATGKAFG